MLGGINNQLHVNEEVNGYLTEIAQQSYLKGSP